MRRALVGRPRKAQPVDRVVRNHVHDGALAREQPHDAVELVVAVVDAGQQRPLVLHRVAGGQRITLGQFDQFFGVDQRRARQQLGAQRGLGGVQGQRQRGLHRRGRQLLEGAPIAHRRKHQALVADAAFMAEQRDRFHHVVEVVRGLAHAHEHHLPDHAQPPRQRHLRDDLGAAQLAQQAALPGHAKHAAHRAADLRRHAQAVARQQHRLDRLAVVQADQQARRAIVARVLGNQPRQPIQIGLERRQLCAHRQRQEVLRLAPRAVLRQGLRPQPQHAVLVTRQGAVIAQSLAQLGQSHGITGRDIDVKRPPRRALHPARARCPPGPAAASRRRKTAPWWPWPGADCRR